MKAVYIEQAGGASAPQYGEQPKPAAGSGEVLVRVAYSGVNFIDTYQRGGLYPIRAESPSVLQEQEGLYGRTDGSSELHPEYPLG